MSSPESENLVELRFRTIEEIARQNARLWQVQVNILKALRHQGFRLLRRGVGAVNHSVELWATENILKWPPPL